MRLWHLTIKRKLPWSAKQKRDWNLVKTITRRTMVKKCTKKTHIKYENWRQSLNLQKQKWNRIQKTRKTETSKQYSPSLDKYFGCNLVYDFKRHPADCYMRVIAGSLESANSSILLAHNLFKDFDGEKFRILCKLGSNIPVIWLAVVGMCMAN